MVANLVEDIDKLFGGVRSAPDPENVERFLDDIKTLVETKLYRKTEKKTLRLSAVGKPDCALWFDINDPPKDQPLSPDLARKFFYGDLIEAFLCFLCAEAGHPVTAQQQQVNLGGVVGHIDGIIGDTLVDIKSSSDYSYKKFARGEVDMFGYVEQLRSYQHATQTPKAGWLVLNKVTGELCFAPLQDPADHETPITKRVEDVKAVVSQPSRPPRNFTSVPLGSSGNMQLCTACKYCVHKFNCWQDANDGQGLKGYKYANGITYLTATVREPNVPLEFKVER